MTTVSKPMPNDKGVLLAAENYDVYNRELIRRVFPRIINEAVDVVYAGSRRKPEIRDIFAFYFTLQAYIDGNPTRADGSVNDRFGACFVSYEHLMTTLRIDRARIRLLADILETNGIIRTVDHYEGTRRFKWYFPSYCPRISEDGYVVDEDGVKIIPDITRYKPRRYA